MSDGASQSQTEKAGGAFVQQMVFNNSSGNFNIGQCGNTNDLMTGTVGGDGVINTGAKTLHLGIAGSRGTIRIGANIGIGQSAADSFGGGVGVMFLANAATPPSTNPTGGGILYTEGGKLMYRGSSGTVKELASA